MKYAKVKTLIVSCIRNMCKTNKQKTRECKTSRVIHNHIIIFLFILYFKSKYDDYNILLKQFIHFSCNICPVRY